jgi:hypothetical protein
MCTKQFCVSLPLRPALRKIGWKAWDSFELQAGPSEELQFFSFFAELKTAPRWEFNALMPLIHFQPSALN